MSAQWKAPRVARRSAVWAVLAASLLSGCVGGTYGGIYGGTNGGRYAGPTPPDPPPLPARKPWPQAADASAVAPAPQSSQQPIQQQVTAAVPAAIPGEFPGGRSSEPALLVGYSVLPGDTVFGIGRRLSVPLRSIIEANRLQPPYALRTGQVLRIPNPRKHVVAKGDTVYGISQRYRVNLTELVRLNHMPAPFTISPGQDLILPVPEPAPQTVVAAVKQPPAPSAAVTAAPPVAAAPPVNPAPALGGKSLEPAAQTAALRPPPQPPAPLPLAAIPTPPPRGGSTFLWPVQGRLVTSYGPKDGGLHNDGINIAAPRGTPVRAADNGVVVYVGNELRGFGNLILIKHADNWVTAYAHNDTSLVARGNKVTRGQTIARVGSSGNVSEPQLHFEIRQGTRAVNPMGLLDPQRASLAN